MNFKGFALNLAGIAENVARVFKQISEQSRMIKDDIETNKNNETNYLSNLIPCGSVQMYAGATAPNGWLICNGQAVSRTSYSKLFSILSTTWGVGDGSTTFNVPDLMGACPAGVGTSTGYTYQETVALGTKYNDNMQGHYHKTTLGTANRTLTGSGTIVPGGSATTYITEPIEDTVGSYGTPRVGSVTKGKTVGINFIIKH